MSDDNNSDASDGKWTFCGVGMRFAILLTSLLVLIFAFGNGLLFNFAVVCMTKETPVLGSDGSEQIITGELFSQSEKAALYSAVAVGTLLGCAAIVPLLHLFGGRRVFVGYGCVSALSTILSPVCAMSGFVPFFIVRVAQGIGAGMSFTLVGHVTSAWAPIAGSGLFLAWLMLYVQLAPALAMSVSGFACTSPIGWQGVFYVFGALTFGVLVLFYAVFRDSPRHHSRVSATELERIEHGKKGINRSASKHSHRRHPPYLRMISDPVVLGHCVACFGNLVGVQLFMQFAPVYFTRVLGIDLRSAGVIAAAPFVLSVGVKLIVGPLSDCLTCIPRLVNVKIFNSLSQLSMAVAYVVLALLPPTALTAAQVCYMVVIVGSSINGVGFYKATQLSCGPYASVVMSWFSFLNSGVVLVLPLLKTAIAAEDRLDQWRILFYITASVTVITTLSFLLTAEVEARSWTWAGHDGGDGKNDGSQKSRSNGAHPAETEI